MAILSLLLSLKIIVYVVIGKYVKGRVEVSVHHMHSAGVTPVILLCDIFNLEVMSLCSFFNVKPGIL